MKKQEKLTDTDKYQAWRDKLTQNQISVKDIQPLHLERAEKDGSILYALLHVEANAPEDVKLHPTCFLKGDAVSMLVVLIDEETDNRYVLLVKQRRICDGSEHYEHPAGMIDEADDSPADVAARELKEEARLTVSTDELTPLFDKPLFSSTATSDEALHLFYLERRLPLADIQAMHGLQTGEESENEHTQLYICTLPEAHRLVRNLHGIMSHLLYLKHVGDYETMRLL